MFSNCSECVDSGTKDEYAEQLQNFRVQPELLRVYIVIKYLAVFTLFCISASAIAECNKNIPGHIADRYDFTATDGVALDKVTGLSWMRCHNEVVWNSSLQSCEYTVDTQGLAITTRLSWAEALLEAEQANTDNTLGFSDWRLPNIKEIASIQDMGCENTSNLIIDDSVFLLPSNVRHWSSTPTRLKIGFAVNSPYAWAYDFKAASLGAFSTDIVNKYVVRLVRGNSQ